MLRAAADLGLQVVLASSAEHEEVDAMTGLGRRGGSQGRHAVLCVLSGGISAAELRQAGAVEVYRDAADLLEKIEASPLAQLARSAGAR